MIRRINKELDRQERAREFDSQGFEILVNDLILKKVNGYCVIQALARLKKVWIESPLNSIVREAFKSGLSVLYVIHNDKELDVLSIRQLKSS